MLYRVQANTRGLQHAAQTIANEQRRALHDYGVSLRRGIRSRMAKFTGEMKNDVHFRVRANTRRAELDVYTGGLPQTLVDEYGRRKGAKQPPSSKGTALYAWVAAKLTVRSRGTSKRDPVAEAAFLVARKISRRGIKPRKSFSKEVAERRGDFRNVMERAAERASRIINGAK